MGIESREPTAAQTIQDFNKLMAEFPRFDGVCRPMMGPPCYFNLKEGAVPTPIKGSRTVAEPLFPRLKAELDSLEAQGIIKKVTEPTEWVHPIAIVPKKYGEFRICGDFCTLNKHIILPIFETAAPFQAVRSIPPEVLHRIRRFKRISSNQVR